MVGESLRMTPKMSQLGVNSTTVYKLMFHQPPSKYYLLNDEICSILYPMTGPFKKTLFITLLFFHLFLNQTTKSKYTVGE